MGFFVVVVVVVVVFFFFPSEGFIALILSSSFLAPMPGLFLSALAFQDSPSAFLIMEASLLSHPSASSPLLIHPVLSFTRVAHSSSPHPPSSLCSGHLHPQSPVTSSLNSLSLPFIWSLHYLR